MGRKVEQCIGSSSESKEERENNLSPLMSKSSHPDEGAYGPWIQAQRRGKRKLSTTSKPKTGATPANKTGPGTGAGEGGSRFSILTEGKPDNGSKQDVVTSSQVGPSHDSRKERKEGISTSKNGVAPAHGRLRIKPADPKQ